MATIWKEGLTSDHVCDVKLVERLGPLSTVIQAEDNYC